jgi:hypothetical protein
MLTESAILKLPEQHKHQQMDEIAQEYGGMIRAGKILELYNIFKIPLFIRL